MDDSLKIVDLLTPYHRKLWYYDFVRQKLIISGKIYSSKDFSILCLNRQSYLLTRGGS